jgi:hypothetical protein
MKKLGLICLVILIAIGSVGIVYAKWSQNLALNGTVATGTFDVIFNSFAAPSGQNGSTFSATSVDSHTYTLGCTNLYPGLDGTFIFVLKANGTVPAKITHIYIKQGGVTEATDPSGAVPLKLDADTNNDISITVSGISNTTTIDAGATVSGSILLHTWKLTPDGNDATQNASGSFTVEIDTTQRY